MEGISLKISLGVNISDTNRPGVAAFFGDTNLSLNLSLNALAYSTAGSTIASRKNADGNYYTVSFPDDFVHTINSEDTLDVSDQSGATVPRDPFAGYRSASSPYEIDTPLNITIEIPEGMSIGTNSHATHVKAIDVFSSWENDHSGLAATSPGADYALNSRSDEHHYRDASADPCILIDFNTNKVSERTINDTILTIENSGNTLGGGGYGGMGGVRFKEKATNGEGGGGGGAGMGLHQTISSGNFPTNPTEYSYYQFSNIAVTTGTTGANIPETPDSFLPLPGTGGLGYNWWPHTVNESSNYAANGTSSDIDSFGSGGAGQGDAINAGRSYPSLSSQTNSFTARNPDYSVTQAGWGGNVVYFRSNVWTDSAISGTRINIINKTTGYMRGGAGGGGGGDEGGVGGSGGSWYSSGSYNTSQAAGTPGKFNALALAHTAGLEGSLIFWNTSNVSVSNTFTNERGDGNWMQGRDIRVT